MFKILHDFCSVQVCFLCMHVHSFCFNSFLDLFELLFMTHFFLTVRNATTECAQRRQELLCQVRPMAPLPVFCFTLPSSSILFHSPDSSKTPRQSFKTFWSKQVHSRLCSQSPRSQYASNVQSSRCGMTGIKNLLHCSCFQGDQAETPPHDWRYHPCRPSKTCSQTKAMAKVPLTKQKITLSLEPALSVVLTHS